MFDAKVGSSFGLEGLTLGTKNIMAGIEASVNGLIDFAFQLLILDLEVEHGDLHI